MHRRQQDQSVRDRIVRSKLPFLHNFPSPLMPLQWQLQLHVLVQVLEQFIQFLRIEQLLQSTLFDQRFLKSSFLTHRYVK
jgi:hypothetical protein